jgi:hypothetical protein
MVDDDPQDELIERWMRERPRAAAPPGFTAGVMSRVRQERWRSERYWDLGFNIAVAAGLLLVAVGVLGLVYLSGLSVVGEDVVLLIVQGITAATDQLAPVLPTYIGAFVLTGTALGLWWFVEQ